VVGSVVPACQLLDVWANKRADLLADILEIEVPVKSPNERSEGDQHLCQRRVDIHKELLADILARKTTKVDLVEAGYQLVLPTVKIADTESVRRLTRRNQAILAYKTEHMSPAP
jgi:hypothetical protein